MDMGTAFYVLMLLWALLGAYLIRTQPNPYPIYGGHLLLFLVILLLGWKAFGPPLR